MINDAAFRHVPIITEVHATADPNRWRVVCPICRHVAEQVPTRVLGWAENDAQLVRMAMSCARCGQALDAIGRTTTNG